jgi:SAM-dependent methyltransferase
VRYRIAEFLHFRDTLYVSGWVDAGEEVRSLFVVYADQIQVAEFAVPPNTRRNFTARVPIPESQPDGNIKLGFELKSGARLLIESPYKQAWEADTSYHALFQRYRTMLNELPSGKMVEIGSRARSGYTFREIIPPGVDYVGLDIRAGPNVDLIGDAHKLSTYFAPESVDAMLSIAVFDHLLMPWKVALEMNRVMKPGGFAFISTHQIYPLHEEPWDFWRFSSKAWHGIFNRSTGFEIIDTTYGERAYMVPGHINDRTFRLDRIDAFMASQVLVRKIGPTTEQWNVEMDGLVEDVYPL